MSQLRRPGLHAENWLMFVRSNETRSGQCGTPNGNYTGRSIFPDHNVLFLWRLTIATRGVHGAFYQVDPASNASLEFIQTSPSSGRVWTQLYNHCEPFSSLRPPGLSRMLWHGMQRVALTLPSAIE